MKIEHILLNAKLASAFWFVCMFISLHGFPRRISGHEHSAYHLQDHQVAHQALKLLN